MSHIDTFILKNNETLIPEQMHIQTYRHYLISFSCEIFLIIYYSTYRGRKYKQDYKITAANHVFSELNQGAQFL